MTSGSGSRACIIALTIADTEITAGWNWVWELHKKLITGKKCFVKKVFFMEQCQYKNLWASFLSFPWNLQIAEMVFCYQNCSDPLWEKNILVIKKNFWNSKLKAENLQNVWDHKNNLFEQWSFITIFETECFFNLFLEVSHSNSFSKLIYKNN